MGEVANPIYKTLTDEITAQFQDTQVQIPVTLISGTRDEDWPVESNGQLIYDALMKTSGNEEYVELHIIENGGHAMHNLMDVYSSHEKALMKEKSVSEMIGFLSTKRVVSGHIFEANSRLTLGGLSR